jgi:hypothetical protein
MAPSILWLQTWLKWRLKARQISFETTLKIDGPLFLDFSEKTGKHNVQELLNWGYFQEENDLIVSCSFF